MTRYFITSIGPLLALLTMSFFPTLAQARKNHLPGQSEWSARSRYLQVIVLSPLVPRSQRPPGWDRGRKTGWGACSVPPGQAKRIGCNPTWFTGGRITPRRRPVLVIPLP